jgi:RNA polymerase sigma-70 factor (ECF subfamily)
MNSVTEPFHSLEKGLLQRENIVLSVNSSHDPPVNERQLLARARRLDAEALNTIHQTYYDSIFRYIAFRVGDRYVAEDLTSEVFLRLLAELKKRRGPKKTLRGWLFRVASNVVTDHYRQQGRAQEVELSPSIPDGGALPHHLIEELLNFEALHDALNSLTPEQRDVIALRYGWEMPFKEIAQTLRKSENAVKQLQIRALARLARYLEKRGGSHV